MPKSAVPPSAYLAFPASRSTGLSAFLSPQIPNHSHVNVLGSLGRVGLRILFLSSTPLNFMFGIAVSRSHTRRIIGSLQDRAIADSLAVTREGYEVP